MIAILDNIRSLHNVGSIFRTADAVGVEKIYLCGITPLPVDRFGKPQQKFVKVSLGAEEYVSWEHAANTARLITRLKKQGYTIIALEQASRAHNLFTTNLSKSNFDRLVVVVGNEVNGVSKTVLQRADVVLQIPMYGRKESLNVSVAFGIAAYQLRSI